jgi:hypothetical protein
MTMTTMTKKMTMTKAMMTTTKMTTTKKTTTKTELPRHSAMGSAQARRARSGSVTVAG